MSDTDAPVTQPVTPSPLVPPAQSEAAGLTDEQLGELDAMAAQKADPFAPPGPEAPDQKDSGQPQTPPPAGDPAQGGAAEEFIDIPSDTGEGIYTRIPRSKLPSVIQSKDRYIQTLRGQLNDLQRGPAQGAPQSPRPEELTALGRELIREYQLPVDEEESSMAVGLIDRLVQQKLEGFRGELSQESALRAELIQVDTALNAKYPGYRNDPIWDKCCLRAQLNGLRPTDAQRYYEDYKSLDNISHTEALTAAQSAVDRNSAMPAMGTRVAGGATSYDRMAMQAMALAKRETPEISREELAEIGRKSMKNRNL